MNETTNGTAPVVSIACVNFTPVWGDKAATLAKMKANIVEAANQGADIIVFPEGALQGPGSCSDCAADRAPCAKHLANAETVPGPSTQTVQALAAQHDVYVV